MSKEEVKEEAKEAKEAKPKANPEPKIKSNKLNLKKYMHKIAREDKHGNVEEVEVYQPKYTTHIGKCQVRTAKQFDVSIEHIDEAYFKLSGRKIDGFIINDIIDRFGFSTGIQESRAALCKRYKFTPNQRLVDVAEGKLKEILSQTNVQKAYMEYINDVKALKDKERMDEAVYGE